MSKLFITDLPKEETIYDNFSKMYPDIDANSMYPFLLLRKVSTDLDVALDAYFSRYNLSIGRYTLLTLLAGKEDGLMPSELANKVGVTQATISGLINSLEKAELVTRQTHKKDGRAFVITLTQKGSDLVKKLSPEYFSKINTVMSDFNVPDKKALGVLLQRLIDRLPLLNQHN